MNPGGWIRRLEILAEFYRMARDRRRYLLLPVLLAIVVILLFLAAGETPILIPFFYAIF